MFIIDNYTINNNYDIIFNKSIYNNLFLLDSKKKEFNNNNFGKKFPTIPNLLFYGLEGSGKKSLINFLIKKIYNLNKIILKKTKFKITGYGNNSIDVFLEHSDHHIIIEPFNTGFDKYLIQEVVKEYIKSKFIDLNGKNIYKIILINNIDKLSYYAQTSLRCTMEKYSNYCKFILCGTNISKIIDPIKSRCLLYKIPRPNNFEILKFILILTKNNNIIINKNQINYLINKFDRNIKKIIWQIDLIKNNITYKDYISESLDFIINLIYCKNINYLKNIKLIREKLYLLFTTNIDFKKLLELLLIKLFISVNDDKILFEIVNEIALTDLNLSKGKRVVIHFENLIFNIMYILQK